MSLLWPDLTHIGVFRELVSARNRRGHACVVPDATSSDPAESALEALKRLLACGDLKLRKRGRVSLAVSDAFALVTELSWQPSLTTLPEWQSYARACFEAQGSRLNENWLINVEYPRYGGLGLAYALHRPWLLNLADVFEEHDLHLNEVLPISAKVLTAGCSARARGGKAFIVLDSHGVSALLFDSGRLVAYEIEPDIADRRGSAARLLLRMRAMHLEFQQAEIWPVASESLTDEFLVQSLGLNASQVREVRTFNWSSGLAAA